MVYIFNVALGNSAFGDAIWLTGQTDIWVVMGTMVSMMALC